VDQWFSSGAFRLHCPPYQVEQSAEFVSATERVIEALARKPSEGCSRPFVWMQGPLPSRRIVIAETNPTVVLAMLMPRGKPEYLVSRSKPRNVGGRVVRSKSDWYWACGARFSIASALNADDVVNETDHDRIAALVCLTVGEQLSGQALDGGSAVAIGGRDGVYVLPSRCHADWQDALEPMIYYGALDRRGIDVPFAPEWNTPPKVEEVSDGNKPPRVDLEEGPRQEQTAQANPHLLRLTDTGALHATANPWLRGLSGTVIVLATKIGRIVLTEGAAGWKLQPTAATIARALGFPLPLSKARPLEIAIKLGRSTTPEEHRLRA